MRAVLQRVSTCKVFLRSEPDRFCFIKRGLLVLLGVEKGDTDIEIDFLIDKIVNLRIFEDDQGKMNLSLLDICGDLMLVSQFTLMADTKKGRRPSFIGAGDPTLSEQIFDRFVKRAKEKVKHVEKGWFGQFMEVESTNDGPVTIIMESK